MKHKPNFQGLKYFLLDALSSKYLKSGITPHTYNKLFELDLIFDLQTNAFNRVPKPWMEDFKSLLIIPYRAVSIALSTQQKRLNYTYASID